MWWKYNPAIRVHMVYMCIFHSSHWNHCLQVAKVTVVPWLVHLVMPYKLKSGIAPWLQSPSAMITNGSHGAMWTNWVAGMTIPGVEWYPPVGYLSVFKSPKKGSSSNTNWLFFQHLFDHCWFLSTIIVFDRTLLWLVSIGYTHHNL